ncbi:MAG TPA: AarF/ABC1/UbiB kinase family protein [Solirubrobacteraceae bacterium]|jgi:predicted unusual protein kinase regulating ubiquinone biosynthesis (AarF/ABC1/UbiB family)|nr:AarF/ABC1/UbiB kinase family protein [Solirubrobacteraceae bacterium]
MSEIATDRLKRTSRFAGVVARQGARLVGAHAAAAIGGDRDGLTRRHEEAAAQVVKTLGSMKGAAMKVGQLASFVQADFVPREYQPIYQEALASLRADAPPLPWAQVERVLHEEWGEPPARMLADVDPQAIACASIGQVHRAVLRDGREVALKIQYPGIDSAVRADLGNVRAIAGLVRMVAPKLDARAIAAEIVERVGEELDYELEAQNHRLFARAYRGHPFAYVPEVHSELCRRRVLVVDWVNGAPFETWRTLPADERDRLGEILFRFLGGSMCRLRAYNSDPHPGNYLLGEDGRVAFFDFGAVNHVTAERLARMIRSAVEIHRGDAAAVKRTLIELGYVSVNDDMDADRYLGIGQAAVWWFGEDREITIDARLVRRAIAVADPRGPWIDVIRHAGCPPEDVLFLRLGASVLSVLGQLEPTCNWYRITREWIDDAEPAGELGALEDGFWGGQEQVRRAGRAARLTV